MVALLLASATVACGGSGRDRSAALAASSARRLVGVWDVRFHLDRPVRLTAPPVARDLKGTIALIENETGGTSFPELPAVVEHGVYDVDFTPFGFDLRQRGTVPTAVGGTASDSVKIVLAPGSDDMSLVMRGRFAGDSVAGAWTVYSRAAGGGGRFVMRRHR